MAATATVNNISRTVHEVNYVESPKVCFRQHDLQYRRQLNDDYNLKNMVSFTIKNKNDYFSSKAKLGINASYNQVGDARNMTINFQGQGIKFNSRVLDRDVELLFNTNSLRLWSNLGTIHFGRTPMNLTGKLKMIGTDRFSGNLCLEYQGRTFHVFNRIDIKQGLVPYFNEKVIININKNCQLGYVMKLNLLQQKLARYNVFWAYGEKDYSVYFEHLSRNKEKFEVGKFIFAGLYRSNIGDLVLKAAYRPHKPGKEIRAKLNFSNNQNENPFCKTKIDNTSKITSSIKYHINKNWNVTLVTRLHALKTIESLKRRPSAQADANLESPVKFGLNIEYSS